MSGTAADQPTMGARTGLPNRTLAAAFAVLGYATLIGYTDNYVRVVAVEAGLWQFHLIRTLMAAAVFFAVAPVLGLDLRPKSWRAVAGRSALHGGAMLIYFGCLAFLPVAQVAAGLFTAPIFVLLIARFVYGHALGPARILAAAVGFLGVILALMPGTEAPLGWASVLPIAAGALYALGNIATREWCVGESAATLTLGFFVALGAAGLLGVLALAVVPLPVAAGADGFIARGWVWPTGTFLYWTAVQAVGSMVAVGLVVRAYQLAEASRVAIFEYVILPIAALWGWFLWGETLGWVALVGMALIVAAGSAIVWRGQPDA
ncbi:DMT family transporter [Pararhodobacter sp. SW119]|uniref:DMT family transporter n=1 Tax=Pararhodobacter sp. SW119 TaxID=2780075 RepID=UPI001FD7E01B|nr:DMT family transporter [Pararhodobacter sp. SW119]